MERQVALLESDLNCLKREREVMDQNYNRRKHHLLAQSTMAINEQRRSELICQITVLDNEWRQETIRMNSKIYFAIQELNNKRRQQQ